MDVFALATRIESSGSQQVMRELDAVDRVGRRTSQGLNTVSTSTRTLSSSFGGMSAVLQDVARDFAITGSVGTREFKQLAREGTELALLMGAGGPIVAAAGLIGLTLVTSFQRAAAEATKTRIKIIEEFEQIVAGASMDSLAARTTAETEKLVQQRAELADREAQLAEIPVMATQSLVEAGKGIVRQNTDRQKAEERIADLKNQIAITELNITRLQERQNTLALDAAATDRVRAADAARRAAAVEREREQREIIAGLERQLSSLENVRPTLAPTFDLNQLALEIEERGIRIPIIPEIRFPGELLKEEADRLTRQATAIAGAIESGIADVFSNLFSGDDLLAGFGSMMVRFGEIIIEFSALMEAFRNAILANPLLAGPIGFAVGAALIALGSSLRGAAGGRGGGSRSVGYGTGRLENTSRFTLGTTTETLSTGSARSASNLTPARPVVVNQTIIGANDPRAQRDIVDLVRNAAARGIKP